MTKWVSKAIECVLNVAQDHNFMVSKAYNIRGGGYECLEKVNDTFGVFKFYVLNSDDKLCFCIATHYNILDKDLLNTNMPCYRFSSDNTCFEEDKEDIENVVKKIISKVKGLNNTVRKNIEVIEKKFLITHELDTTFDNFEEQIETN